MKYITFCLFIILSHTADAQSSNSAITERADAGLLKFMKDNHHMGITAGIATADEVIWTGAAGYMNEDNHLPFTSQTLTRLASIAKSITAVAVMQLVEQDKLDLDVAIQTYIPDYPVSRGSRMTTRHLLNHTSGISGYASGKEAETTKEYETLSDAVDLFKNRKLEFTPGSEYMYSTYGYVVLGLIIEKVSGLSYGDYVQQHIFDKAGMTNTGIEHFDVAYENKSSLYSRKKNGKIKEGKKNNLSNRIPGGGFYSTTIDVLKFGQAILNNTLITKASLELMMYDPQIRPKENGNGYGFGWFLYGDDAKGGGPIIGHSGGQTGVSSQLMILPESGIVSVAISNTSNTDFEITGLSIGLFRLAHEVLSIKK